MKVKMSKQPPPVLTASAIGPCPTVIQIVRRPGTGSLPSTIAPPDHPTEHVQAGGETMIDVLTEICNRIWRTGEKPTPLTQSLIITLHKKGNLQLRKNYRTISLISHSSKVMLKVILNRLNWWASFDPEFQCCYF